MSSPKYRTRKIYSRFQSLTNENSTIRSCNSSTTGNLHSYNPLNILNSLSHRPPFMFFNCVWFFAILTCLYSLYQLPLSSICSDTHLATSSSFTPLLQQILIFQHWWSFLSSVALLPEMISNIHSHFSVYNTVYPLVGS